MGNPSPPSNDRRWLRLGPAAELLGVSENTLRRWSDAGKLVCYRSAGGHRRYRRADVEAVLRDGAAGTPRRRAARAATPESYAATIAGLEARNRDLQMLVEAGEDVSRLSTRDVLESVVRRLSRLTHTPVTDIYAVEGEHLRALVSYDHGVFDPSWEDTTCTLREYPCSAVAISKRRISCAASLDDPVLTPIGRRSLEKWGYQSQLSAPLVVRDEVIGILELSDHVPRDYAEHLALIEGLSHVAARAIDNAGLFEEIRRRNEILHELVEFGAAVTSVEDVTELLRGAAKRLVDTLGAADCDVFTLEGDTLLAQETDKQFYFADTTTFVYARKLVKQFPKYEDFVPKTFKFAATLDARKFEDALRTIEPFAPDAGAHGVFLSFSEGSLKVRATDGGNAEDEVPYTQVTPDPIFETAEFKNKLNFVHLMDFVKVVSGDILFQANTDRDPAVLSAGSRKLMTAAVLI